MQNPHWSAWWRLNASCSGESRASSRERLHGLDGRTVRLDREQAAGAHGDAVEPDGAGAADAVLAAHVGAGEAEAVPEEVGQEQPRLDVLAPPCGR